MSFGDAIKSYFKNYANFSGRARRSEFWFASLFVGLVSFALSILASVVDGSQSIGVVTVVYYLWSLALVIPSLAITVRRLHDVNKSGGYYFIGLIPLVGAILLLVEMVRDSQPGPNRFGNPVK
jgi:uncharacterized membrane protein YhaH (DUF805 family)